MSHWDVVWLCFGLTAGVLLIDFWQSGLAARQVRERLLLGTQEPGKEGKGA